MSIIDIIKQKREEKFIKKINLGKSSKEEIIKGFEKLVNKEKFISHIYEYLYVNDEVAEALKDKVIEMSKNDKDFLVNNAMKLPMVGLNFDETKEIIKSCFSAEEIVSDIELFSLYGYDYDKNVLMQSVDNKLVSFEVLEMLPQDYRDQFISGIEIEDMSPELLKLASENLKRDLAQKYIMDDSVNSKEVKGMFSDEMLLESVKEIVQKDATLMGDRCFEFIPIEKVNEIVGITKMNYVLQNTDSNSKLHHSIQKMIDDKDFIKYLEYRQDIFNLGEYGTAEPQDTKQPVMNEVKSSIEEYNENSKIINEVLNSDMKDSHKTKLLLKEYILDKNKTMKIESLDELSKYPNEVLEQQINAISLEESDDICKEIIVKNLTGFSLDEYLNYSKMFLETHDTEEILEANDGNEQKLTNIKIVREIVDLMETMDEKQLKEFATNIATRSCNELNSGEFSLVSLRENYKTFISNLKREYGKEFNQSLDYNIQNTEQISVNGNIVKVHDISGEFKILLHRTSNEELQIPKESTAHRTCMSFISEGHYEVVQGDKMKTDSNTIFLVFDNLPEDLLFASSNTNMTSNDNGDKKSRFMTAENTIQKADREEGVGINVPKFTEQTYFYEGFDKSGKFVRIYPKAIGTFEKKPNEKTLRVAEKNGIDVIRIPEMQSNLENMLEKGIITPGLVKGIQGHSDSIIEILEAKEILTKNEKIALELLQKKEDNEILSPKIEQLLQKPVAKGKNDIEVLIDDINISQINDISNETRQIINMINNPEMSRGE